MRKVAIGALSVLMTSALFATPASANQCQPKLQGVCDLVHEARCTVDEVLSAVYIEGFDPRFCTF